MASILAPRRGSRLLLALAVALTGVALVGRAAPARAAAFQPLTLAQAVGQVFMVGAPASGAGTATISAIRDRHVGNVILTGRSSAGTSATARVTGALQALVTPASTGGIPLLVATDQEGGQVQVLSGPGFSTIPSALTQGGLDPGTLRSDAATWGGQLRSAGVGADLAPVLDTVPSPAAAQNNPPIGVFDREYGYTPQTVTAHGGAFAQGMADAGVLATGKHFPGLGRVTANTDTTSGVTDTVTTRTDPYLAPFAAAAQSGVPMMMISSAYYSLIDRANPAAFSSTVIQGMLRGDLGFTGTVISDDLGDAAQVAAWSPGDRAVNFLQAGGDLVLTVDPNVLPAMYDAVLAKAQSDPAFAIRVQQAAGHVLRLKRVPQDLSPVGVGAARTAAGSVVAFVRGTDGSTWSTTEVNGVFGPFQQIPSHIVGGPAAVSPDGQHIDLFVVGSDLQVWQSQTTVDGQGRPTSWAPWQPLGGVAASSPSVASAGGGLVLSERGIDGSVWSRGFTGTSWSGWSSDGGAAISAPAVQVSGGGYQVDVVGTDGVVWTQQLAASGASASGWTSTGVSSATAPAVLPTASWNAVGSQLAVGSGTGLRLVPGPTLGGTVTSGPALAQWDATQTATFARGADSALWVNIASASSSTWYRLGGVLA